MHYHLSFLDDDRHVQVFALVDAGKTRAEAAEELGIEQEPDARPDDWFLPCGGGDNRSAWARRWRDLFQLHLSDYGGSQGSKNVKVAN